MDRPLNPIAARVMRLVTGVNLALAGVWAVLWVVLVATGRTVGSDYTAFYTGWRLVLEGQGTRLYDYAAQAEMQRRILGDRTFEAGLNPFVNPPHLVLPFTPLGLLPLGPGYLVWTAIQVALVVALVWLLWRAHGAAWTRTEQVACLAWLIGFPAMGIAFWQGAFSVLVAAGVAAVYIGLAQGRAAGTAIALLAASVKPQAMAGTAVTVLLSRHRRTVGLSAALGLILAATAMAALGPATWTDYLRILGEHTASYDRYSDPTVMWNLRGTLALILGREQAGLVNGVAFAGFAAGMLGVAWLWRGGFPKGANEGTAARFGLTIVITALLTPHLNPQDGVLGMVAATLAYAAWRGHRHSGWLALAIGLAPLVVLLTNGIEVRAPTILPIRVPTVLLVALGVVLLAALRRRSLAADDLATIGHQPGMVRA